MVPAIMTKEVRFKVNSQGVTEDTRNLGVGLDIGRSLQFLPDGHHIIHSDPTSPDAQAAQYFLDPAGRVIDTRTGVDVTAEDETVVSRGGCVIIGRLATREGLPRATRQGFVIYGASERLGSSR